MEQAILEKIVLTIVGLIVTGLCTWLGSQIVKYKKLRDTEENEIIKKTIENSLVPIQTNISDLKTEINSVKNEIGNVKKDIGDMQKDISKLQKSEINFTTRLEPTQEEIEHLKDDVTEILNTLKLQGIDLQNIREKEATLEKETRCAWRYRIRQLCHVYIARGYMSYEEYTQLQEMFNIYTAIGGNGQTKELYEKTTELDIKTDAEIAALQTLSRGKSCPMVHDDK